jgi:3-oxoadipate enol-lactonase
MPKVLVNDININYLVQGSTSNKVIMFSNSLASNLTMWDLQADELVRQGFCVLRYDSRGHGGSDSPAGPYSVEQLSDDAAALIDKLMIGPVHFCGLSKGGMVAQMMGVRHSNKVQSLTIADSAAFMPAKDIWDQRIMTVEQGGMATIVDGTVERWITAPGRERLPDQVELIRQMILTTPVVGFVACCEAIKSMDMRPTNPDITAPTLVVCGEQDTGTTPEQAQEIASSIPGAELKLINNAAHLSNIEQHKVFNSLVINFLKKLDG